MKRRDDAWCALLVTRLTDRFGWKVPTVWSERINLSRAPALCRRLMRGDHVRLGDILRSPQQREQTLELEVLYLKRDDDDNLCLPNADTEIRAGDELLMVGRRDARVALDLALINEYAMHYVLTGTELPRGRIWQYFARTLNRTP